MAASGGGVKGFFTKGLKHNGGGTEGEDEADEEGGFQFDAPKPDTDTENDATGKHLGTSESE